MFDFTLTSLLTDFAEVAITLATQYPLVALVLLITMLAGGNRVRRR